MAEWEAGHVLGIWVGPDYLRVSLKNLSARALWGGLGSQ
jgi:hypothetical protein